MQLTVKKDHSEQFTYNFTDFPVYIGKGCAADFPNYTALGHWHEDLEFSVVLNGRMYYNVNGDTVSVDEGEGIFINTRQMHYNFSRENRDAEYICILLHPMLLCTSRLVERRFVEPLLSDPSHPCYVFRRDNTAICEKLLYIYEVRDDPLAPMLIQAASFQIWSELYQNIPPTREKAGPVSQKLSALNDMVAFIQKHYRERLSLEEIARAGGVGKTSCCNIFQRYINQSPNAYLIEYRLRKGIELLCSTDMTVAEICYAVGFNGPSYFSESFRKVFGCSPLEYRKREGKY